jgi:hypothetical protein
MRVQERPRACPGLIRRTVSAKRTSSSRNSASKTGECVASSSWLGKLLRQSDKEGPAAGNVGDWHDNRDGELLPLDLRPWPQLRKVHYTPKDIKFRRRVGSHSRAGCAETAARMGKSHERESERS